MGHVLLGRLLFFVLKFVLTTQNLFDIKIDL